MRHLHYNFILEMSLSTAVCKLDIFLKVLKLETCQECVLSKSARFEMTKVAVRTGAYEVLTLDNLMFATV